MNTQDFSNHVQEKHRKRIALLLMESHQSSSFSEEQKRELNELLRNSETNREFAAQFLLDSESLKDQLATEAISALASGQTHKAAPQAVARPRWYQLPVLQLAAAVALCATLLVFWLTRSPIAVIQDEANAVFADGATPKDGELESKAYTLVSGMIAVEFRNGVSMTVKAPAEFEVVDEFRVRLNRGQVRAIAPESGHGFVIETPEVDIQDLGTEFGVSVDGESGDSEVHVFDGQVDVKKRKAKETIASLQFGESAKIQDGQVNLNSEFTSSKFLSPAEISFFRWKEGSERIRKREDVLFYYSFNPQEENDRLLKDESVDGTSIDGTIEGARWVSGRWPGKRALLFDEATDAVVIDIPGELPQFTFMAWVNLDRMDEAKTSILSSQGWNEGKMHLQISRSIQSFAAGIYPKSRKLEAGAKMPTGKWILLTAVVDATSQSATTWINGQLAFKLAFDEIPLIRPGTCLLGNYSPGPKGKRSRRFQGRMDEVILWNRTLTRAEIRTIYRQGRQTPKVPRDA